MTKEGQVNVFFSKRALCWVNRLHSILALGQPSFAFIERVFSILKGTLRRNQAAMLSDLIYLQGAVKINDRERIRMMEMLGHRKEYDMRSVLSFEEYMKE